MSKTYCNICKCLLTRIGQYAVRGTTIECWSCIDKNNSSETVDAIIKGHLMEQRFAEPEEYGYHRFHHEEDDYQEYQGNAEQRTYQAEMDAGYEY